jgi:hypothetical protein
LGSKEGIAKAHGNLGLVYEARGNKTQMSECMTKARDLYREIGIEKDAEEMERRMRLNGCGEGLRRRPHGSASSP